MYIVEHDQKVKVSPHRYLANELRYFPIAQRLNQLWIAYDLSVA